MNEDPKKRSSLEQLVNASSTRDLSLHDHRTGAADVVAAYGMALANAGKTAGRLTSLHSSGTQSAYKSASVAVYGLTINLARRRGWRLNHESLKRVAELALAHHLSPTCPHCKGRGYTLIPGTPTLSDHKCQHCKGSKERPIQRKHHDEIIAVISSLQRIDDMVEGAVKRKRS